MINIVTASHKEHILHDNLQQSVIVDHYPFMVMRGYANIPKAYNDGTVKGEINIYVHHDVWLPPHFETDLKIGLAILPDDWGVLGLAGVVLKDGQRKQVGHIKDRGREWGAPIKDFMQVDTLDELILITKGDLTFDEQFEQDYYGADLCMTASFMGKKSYVIKSFCEHNSGRAFGGRTPGFFQSQAKFKDKWKEYLPIATTCSIMTV
jgi:hypothetical protein